MFDQMERKIEDNEERRGGMSKGLKLGTVLEC